MFLLHKEKVLNCFKKLSLFKREKQNKTKQ